ncbi:MAG: cobalamin-dependent protein [Candidatus Liptonbacteria bacterium]|nr:cobalamin-dependent protein [Candidatus Liptonbacteria bacterium]
MSQLDVLFFVPMNVPDTCRPDPDAPHLVSGVADAIEPNKEIRMMIAYCLRRGLNIASIDANVTNQSPDEVAQIVAEANPRLVVFSVRGFNPTASTQTMTSARLYAQAIKNWSPKTPIMFTGLHPASAPKLTLNTEPDVDFVCVGEGPITAHDLALAIKAGSGFDNVGSLCYRKDGGVVQTIPAPLLDLNMELAIDGWKFQNPEHYQTHPWHRGYRAAEFGRPFVTINTREGCPFSCGFCPIQSQFADGETLLRQAGKLKAGVNSFRTMRPQLVVDELKHHVNRLNVTRERPLYVKFTDEMAGLDNHMVNISKLIIEQIGEGILNFWHYARVDTILLKPHDLETIRRAGGTFCGVGVESANALVRSGQDKKFTNKRIFEVRKALSDAGLYAGFNYIVGLSSNPDENTPADTAESMEETVQLAIALQAEYSNIYTEMAYPGASIYRRAVESGFPFRKLADGRPDWSAFEQYGYSCFPTYLDTAVTGLTREDILAKRDEAHLRIYGDPTWRNMIVNHPGFGPVALEQVDIWMASLTPAKLRRKILEDARHPYVLSSR